MLATAAQTRLPLALAFALLVAVVCDVGIIVIAWTYGQFGGDFSAFWLAARSSVPYAPSSNSFGSPPTALLLFQMFRLVPWWLCFLLFTLFGISAFVQLSRTIYGRSAAMLALLSPAAVQAAVAGQVSFIVTALIFSAFVASPITSGVLLGYAVCLKPQMAFLAPLLFVFTRRWEALAGFAATMVFLASLATAAFGPSIWWQWRDGVTALLNVAGQRGAVDLSVSAAAHGVPLALACGLGVLALYTLRNSPPCTQAPALVACSLFAAPYALAYDLVALAPFAAMIILRGDNWRSAGAAVSFTAALGPLCLGGFYLAARESGPKRSEGSMSSYPRS